MFYKDKTLVVASTRKCMTLHYAEHGDVEYCIVRQACSILRVSLHRQLPLLRKEAHNNFDGTSGPQSNSNSSCIQRSNVTIIFKKKTTHK